MAGDLLVSERRGTEGNLGYRYDSAGNVLSVTYGGVIYYYVRNLQNDITALARGIRSGIEDITTMSKRDCIMYPRLNVGNMGKENIMRFKWMPELVSKITKHEEHMLFEYNRVAEKYKEAFAKYECSLKIELKWDNYLSIKRKRYDYRLPLQIGYRCFIDYMVQKDGEELKLISDDGEADYYSYGESVNITWIHWLWGVRKIFLSTDNMDVFEEDLREYLEEIQEYYTKKV